MSADEVARRRFEAAVRALRTLLDARGAGLPPVMRDGIELSAALSLAEWAAVEARGRRGGGGAP